MTSLDRIRLQIYGKEAALGDGHLVEREARRVEAELMQAGLSVVRDATGLNLRVRRTDILRARDHGLRAVALLASTLSLQEIRRRNANRERSVPVDVLESFYLKHTSLTVDGLLDEGFDQVVVWNDRTTFSVS